MKIVIGMQEEGQSVREVLRVRFSISHRCLSFLKSEAGRIMVNGVPQTVNAVLSAGDELVLGLGEEDGMPLPLQERLSVPILMADDWFLAVNKPAGMPTHPSAGHRGDTLSDAIDAACGRPVVFHAITRLDRNTSGVVLLARHRLAAGFFSCAMARGECKKIYYAITLAPPVPRAGRMIDYIAREAGSVIRRIVTTEGEGELAVTDYETVGECNGRFLLRLSPLTGRTHQLRVQLASRGMPIVGDDLYGGSLMLSRQALHAASLSVPHPLCGRVLIEAPFPPDMKQYYHEV